MGGYDARGPCSVLPAVSGGGKRSGLLHYSSLPFSILLLLRRRVQDVAIGSRTAPAFADAAVEAVRGLWPSALGAPSPVLLLPAQTHAPWHRSVLGMARLAVPTRLRRGLEHRIFRGLALGLDGLAPAPPRPVKRGGLGRVEKSAEEEEKKKTFMRHHRSRDDANDTNDKLYYRYVRRKEIQRSGSRRNLSLLRSGPEGGGESRSSPRSRLNKVADEARHLSQ